MEVHAHTHTPRKKWTHYLFEFLMMFLAVFCGFLAENQREHYVERQREKKYAYQMLSDLRADSVFYVRLFHTVNTYLDRQKRFNEVMNSPSPTNYEILVPLLKLLVTFTMQPTATTYSEMRSSGSFRYFQNDSLSTMIKRYYERVMDFFKTIEADGYDFFKMHLEPFCIDHFRMADMDLKNDSVLTPHPVFLNRTKETEIKLVNIMKMYGAIVLLYREKAVVPAIKRNSEIIEMLKKEYNLK